MLDNKNKAWLEYKTKEQEAWKEFKDEEQGKTKPKNEINYLTTTSSVNLLMDTIDTGIFGLIKNLF